MDTITLKTLYEQLVSYNANLPVVLRVGDQEYPIHDVFFSTAADLTDAKITIETWIKAADENEPGVII